MAKRPAFQFYAGDWMRNAKLRRCSPAARGAWIDVLCLMHDSDEYGVLRWPLKDIANAVGLPIKLLRELADKNVLKGSDKNAPEYSFRPSHAGKLGEPIQLLTATTDEPCWFCSRFVRDEYIRLKRGSGTQFTPDNQPPKVEPNSSPKIPIGDSPKPPFGDGPSVAVCSLQSSEVLTKSSASGERSTPNSVGEIRSLGKFPMRTDWKPNPEALEFCCTTAGVNLTLITQAVLGEFVTYWSEESAANTERQWCQKLLQSAQRAALRAAATPTTDIRSAYEILKAGLDDMEQQA